MNKMFSQKRVTEKNPTNNYWALLAVTSFIFLFLIDTASAITIESSSSDVVLAVIALAYIVGFVGFFGKHEWTAVLGGLMMIAVGGYMLINGIDQYKTMLTTYGGIFTVALGALFAITASVSVIEESV